MKFSQETLNILKHFVSINQGILFEEGSEVLTCAINKTVRGIVKIKEEIPKEFAISNLGQFLGAVSFFENPDIDFKDGHILITSSDGLQTMKYNYSNPVLVKQDNRRIKSLDGLNVVVEFNITKETLSNINKACAIIGCSDICVFNEGKTLFMSCRDKKNPGSDEFKIEIGQYDCKNDFKLYFKKQNINVTNDDFNVVVVDRGISIWTATNSDYDNLVFYVTLEADIEISNKD